MRLEAQRPRGHNRPAMRVGFSGQTGPYAPPAPRALLGGGDGWELALVVEGRRRGSTLRDQLIEPAAERPPESETLGALAVAAGVRALVTSDVNADEAVAKIRDAALDLIV